MKHETEGGMKLHEACKSKPERRTSSYPTRLPLPWKFDKSNPPKRQTDRLKETEQQRQTQSHGEIERDRQIEMDRQT